MKLIKFLRKSLGIKTVQTAAVTMFFKKSDLKTKLNMNPTTADYQHHKSTQFFDGDRTTGMQMSIQE